MSDLIAVVEQVEALARRQVHDERDLLASLDAIYAGFFRADFARYNLGDLRRDAPRLVRRIFDCYLALRARIAEWAEQGLMTRPVQISLRNVFRAARYARDLVGEIGLGHPRLPKGQVTHAGFSGPDFYLLARSEHRRGALDLRPGDVILQRGMAHNSAAIARIGDVDSQFSHIAMVARDRNGALVIVEALIEEGAIVAPVDKALDHGLGRAILFRHRDSALAERASEMIRDTVLGADGETHPRMLYDFSMELAGYYELYCAKLVRLAFSMASTGACRLPTFPTRLDMKNRDFVGRIGVTATETFAPGDMELEPDFEIVAEWRDYRITSELRLKDMIMLKLFEWMETFDYRFRPSFRVRLVGMLGVLSARLPVSLQRLTSRFAGKVPPNMTASAVGAVAMLHWTAEELYATLRALEDRSINATGRQLHPRLVMEELERIRAKKGRRIGYLATTRRSLTSQAEATSRPAV
jgi:hypothetical protein